MQRNGLDGGVVGYLWMGVTHPSAGAAVCVGVSVRCSFVVLLLHA